jgi:CBS domain-containing protein
MDQQIHQVLEGKGKDVEVVGPELTIQAAVARMNERRIGALVVIDADQQLIGIVTERDLLVRVLGASRDPVTTTVAEVMTRELVVIKPADTVARAMTLVTRRRVRHLPVVDDGRLCGMVSAGDLTSWIVRDKQQLIDDLNDYITR